MNSLLSEIIAPFQKKIERAKSSIKDNRETLLSYWENSSLKKRIEKKKFKSLKISDLKNLKRKNFKLKIKNLIKGFSPAQKLILLTVAVCMPAGIIMAVVIAGFMKRKGT